LKGRPRDPVAEALRAALEEMWRYFDRRGVMNSDGRRMIAAAAKAAARAGLRRSASMAWRYLKNPTLEEAQRLLSILGEEEGGRP
jgi:hypothetical protein